MNRINELLQAALFILIAVSFRWVGMPYNWFMVIVSAAIIYGLFIILKTKENL